jgi:hypothetical protein
LSVARRSNEVQAVYLLAYSDLANGCSRGFFWLQRRPMAIGDGVRKSPEHFRVTSHVVCGAASDCRTIAMRRDAERGSKRAPRLSRAAVGIASYLPAARADFRRQPSAAAGIGSRRIIAGTVRPLEPSAGIPRPRHVDNAARESSHFVTPRSRNPKRRPLQREALCVASRRPRTISRRPRRQVGPRSARARGR